MTQRVAKKSLHNIIRQSNEAGRNARSKPTVTIQILCSTVVTDSGPGARKAGVRLVALGLSAGHGRAVGAVPDHVGRGVWNVREAGGRLLSTSSCRYHR